MTTGCIHGVRLPDLVGCRRGLVDAQVDRGAAAFASAGDLGGLRLPAKLLDVRKLSAEKEREYLVLSPRKGPRIHAYRIADNTAGRSPLRSTTGCAPQVSSLLAIPIVSSLPSESVMCVCH
jgi:hypothetical protein